MKKQKSIGNKGFSLVELIIVIAIMAILVGVMAPNLLRYVEKTNVSSDTQLADSVKTAITTAMMDPAVLNSTDNSCTTFVNAHDDGSYVDLETSLSGDFLTAIADTLGSTQTTGAGLASELLGNLKSAHATTAKIQVQVIGSNSVAVQITTTDVDAKKVTDGTATPIEVK